MKTSIIKLGDKTLDDLPVCQHCEKKLSEVKDFLAHYKFFSNMHLFACPHCNKIINIVITSK